MRFHIEYTEYESGLCTFLSFMKSIVGLVVFWIVFNIPSFAFLLSGGSGSTAGIMFVVFGAVAIAAFAWFLFLDLDKLDDKLCKEKKKSKTASNPPKEFFEGLIEKVSPAFIFGSDIYIEFVIYALFKVRLIFLFSVEEKKIDDEIEKAIVDVYDSFQFLEFGGVADEKMSMPHLKVELIQNRLSSYEKVLSNSNAPSDEMFFSQVSETLYWLCENGWKIDGGKKVINKDFEYKMILSKNVAYEKYYLVHDAIDIAIIKYCDEKLIPLVDTLLHLFRS